MPVAALSREAAADCQSDPITGRAAPVVSGLIHSFMATSRGDDVEHLAIPILRTAVAEVGELRVIDAVRAQNGASLY
jgi:hypothetical protein